MTAHADPFSATAAERVPGLVGPARHAGRPRGRIAAAANSTAPRTARDAPTLARRAPRSNATGEDSRPRENRTVGRTGRARGRPSLGVKRAGRAAPRAGASGEMSNAMGRKEEGKEGKEGKERKTGEKGAGRPRGERRCAHLEGCEALPAEIIYGVPEEGVARHQPYSTRSQTISP